MNLVLKVMEFYIPEALKKRTLTDLFGLTARAFGTTPPETQGLSSAGLLEAYAVFAREEAEKLPAEGPERDAVKARLYENAQVLGRQLRQRLRLGRPDEILLTSQILYKILGISFEGRPDGEAIIRKCYFSRLFTGSVCRLISSLDEGVAAGLSNGGKFDFFQRMTEGSRDCRARFHFEDVKK